MKKRKLSKNIIFKSVGLFAGLLLLFLFYFFCVKSTVKNDSLFEVAKGASVSAIASQLQDYGLIDSIPMFKIAVRGNGGKIQTGKYEIPEGTSVWRIARMFATGDIATVTVVVPEGLTVKQIKQLLLDTPTLTGSVECGKGTDLPVCDLHDGDLFPDTYKVARGTSRLAFLDLMRKKMDDTKAVWEKTGRMMPKQLKNWNDIITV